MRLLSSSVRRLTGSATHTIAGLRRVIGAPLRWPRITTRLLMVLVAIVAVGIWALLNVPQAIERTIAYQEMADFHAGMERRASELERESSTRASAIQSQLEQWRRNTGSADEMTEHYFDSRLEFYVVDAKYQREMVAHHANLKNKYRRARWFALVSSARDPGPPTDRVLSPPLAREPGKIFEIITEGGISGAFSPRGTGLAVGCRHETVRLLELPSRKLLASFPLPERDAHSVNFSPDGTTLFAIGDGRVVRRWEVATGHARRPIPWSDQSPGQPGPLDFATEMACSPDGGTIAVAAGGFLGKPSKPVYAIRVLDTRTGKLNWEHRGTGSWAYSVAFSPDGTTLACGADAAVLLDARTGNLKRTLKPVIGYIVGVAFSPDGRTLASAGADRIAPGVGPGGSGRVTLWDVGTGGILRTLDGPTDHPMQVAFSPDGRAVAAGGTGPAKTSRDKSSGQRTSKEPSEVRLWDVATGKLIWTAEGESNCAFSLDFSPDGKSLGFCDKDYVYIVDANTGRLKQIVK